MSAIGVIGGTGVYDPTIFENIHEESLMTPYGEIDYVQGTYHGKNSNLCCASRQRSHNSST